VASLARLTDSHLGTHQFTDPSDGGRQVRKRLGHSWVDYCCAANVLQLIKVRSMAIRRLALVPDPAQIAARIEGETELLPAAVHDKERWLTSQVTSDGFAWPRAEVR
jgi:hypothetical protein